MSIQSEVNRITTNIAAAYTALSEKGAEMPEQQNSQNLAAAILSIQEGSGGSSGGEEEIPDDGKTRIFIHLEDGRTSPKLGCCPKGTVTVDWGDGTEPYTLTGTSVGTLKYTPVHEYAEPGDYVITLTVDGAMYLMGKSSVSKLLSMSGAGSSDIDFAYASFIRKVVLGDGVEAINTGAFANCAALSSIVISDSVTAIAASAFRYCFALCNVTIPDSVTIIQYSAFDNCCGVRYYDFSAHTSVPALGNANVFTGIAADCEIRVPAALYDEWIAATNWSTYADYIVAV